MAAFLSPLVSWEALALEGAFCVDAVTISTQSDVLALVDVCLGAVRKCNLCEFAKSCFFKAYDFPHYICKF